MVSEIGWRLVDQIRFTLTRLVARGDLGGVANHQVFDGILKRINLVFRRITSDRNHG